MAFIFLLSKTLKPHKLLPPIPRRSPLFPSLSPFSTSLPSPPPPSPPPPPPPLPPASAAAAASSASSAAAASPSPSQEKEWGIWSKLFLFLPGAITFGLGTWQLFRRQEKMEMLDYRKKRLEMEPIMWNEAPLTGQDSASSEFKRVVCEGYFDESKSIYVGPRSRSISGVTENGYYVITPLVPRETGHGRHLFLLIEDGFLEAGVTRI